MFIKNYIVNFVLYFDHGTLSKKHKCQCLSKISKTFPSTMGRGGGSGAFWKFSEKTTVLADWGFPRQQGAEAAATNYKQLSNESFYKMLLYFN